MQHGESPATMDPNIQWWELRILIICRKSDLKSKLIHQKYDRIASREKVKMYSYLSVFNHWNCWSDFEFVFIDEYYFK